MLSREFRYAKDAEPCWQDTKGTPEKLSYLLENRPELDVGTLYCPMCSSASGSESEQANSLR
jgi:hypothetical protein